MHWFWADWRTRTTLARRTLVVYVLSVLVTSLVGAALTYRSLQEDLESDARSKLLLAARLYGLAVFSRLAHADQVLQQLTASRGDGDDSHLQMDAESPL